MYRSGVPPPPEPPLLGDDDEEPPAYRSFSPDDTEPAPPPSRGAKVAQAQIGKFVRNAPPIPSTFQAAADAGVPAIVHSHLFVVPHGEALDVHDVDDAIALIKKEMALAGGLLKRDDVKMMAAGATTSTMTLEGVLGLEATQAAKQIAVGMAIS